MTMVDQDFAECYERDGFLICKNLLDVSLLVRLNGSLQDTIDELNKDNERKSKGLTLQKVNLWLTNSIVKELVLNSKIVSVCKCLLKTEHLKLWHDQLLVKPAKIGLPSAWHQDFPYWPMQTPDAITCWIPLTDVSAVNGSIKFIRGSHNWKNETSIYPFTLEDLQDMIGNSSPIQRYLFSCELTLGDCTFHHGLTIHGADGNNSPSDRCIIKVVYMKDDITFKSQSHHLTDSIKLLEGQKIVNDLFLTIS